MKTYNVSHSDAEGFQLRLVEVPWWATKIEQTWPAWPNNIRVLEWGWWHLTQWVFRFTDKRETLLTKVEIDRATAELLYPDAWSWWLDEVDEDNLPCETCEDPIKPGDHYTVTDGGNICGPCALAMTASSLRKDPR